MTSVVETRSLIHAKAVRARAHADSVRETARRRLVRDAGIVVPSGTVTARGFLDGVAYAVGRTPAGHHWDGVLTTVEGYRVGMYLPDAFITGVLAALQKWRESHLDVPEHARYGDLLYVTPVEVTFEIDGPHRGWESREVSDPTYGFASHVIAIRLLTPGA